MSQDVTLEARVLVALDDIAKALTLLAQSADKIVLSIDKIARNS